MRHRHPRFQASSPGAAGSFRRRPMKFLQCHSSISKSLLFLRRLWRLRPLSFHTAAAPLSVFSFFRRQSGQRLGKSNPFASKRSCSAAENTKDSPHCIQSRTKSFTAFLIHWGLAPKNFIKVDEIENVRERSPPLVFQVCISDPPAHLPGTPARPIKVAVPTAVVKAASSPFR